MQSPLITVLIDTYNYGHFIEQAIESVIAQDFPADQLEILVIDDGSTDDTGERVGKYGSRIKYLTKKNAGQGSAFNLGFERASGEIVALLDADDYFLPQKLRSVVEQFQAHPEAGMVYHQLLNLNAASGELTKSQVVSVSGFVLDDKRKILTYEPYPTSCLAFRREIAVQLLPMTESIRLQADTYLTLLMPLLADIIPIEEPLAVYRMHGQNLFYEKDEERTKDRKRRSHEMFMTILEEAEKWVRVHRKGFRRKETRLYFDRWPLVWQRDIFKIDPPNRLEFVLFLIRQNRVRSSQQSWKFTLWNYLSAPIAFCLGYKRAGVIDEWMVKVRRGLNRRLPGEQGNRVSGDR